MTTHTEKPHANRILILLLLKKIEPGVSGKPYSLNIAMKFVFLIQIKHQVITVRG